MSNNLIAVTNNLPDYLRGGELQYEDSGLGAGITPRAPKLSVTTAKQWSITKDGAQMILPQPTVKVVFIASAANITKAWYAKGYVQGSTDAPDCFSNDGKVPAPGVKAPQCTNCAGCPKNAFGSHPVTGRGKACGDRKLTVVVWEGDPNTLTTFNVPTMSMQALKKLDTELRNANIPPQSVLCELSFDPATQYPVVKIAAVGFLDKATAQNLLEKSRSQEVADLLRETDYETPAEQQATDSPVPNQTVTLGGQVEQPAQEQPQQQTFAPQQPQQPPVADQPARRKRRTKAEMEAARAAEAAAAAGQQTVASQPNPVTQAESTMIIAAAAALQPENQQVQQPQADTAPAGGMNIGDLLSKWQG